MKGLIIIPFYLIWLSSYALYEPGFSMNKQKYVIFNLLWAMLLLPMFSTAQNILWAENFETPQRWITTQGSWMIGSPSQGPPTAFEGANCAGTVLNGDYPTNANTIFYRDSTFLIPNSQLAPRLRFKHWFKMDDLFDPLDRGELVIRINGSTSWLKVSPSYDAIGGGWTETVVDLSSFGGLSIEIGFRFISNNVGQDDGWYIDLVELLEGRPVFNNPEGFEMGWGDWYAEKGSWQFGSPVSGPGAAFSGFICAGTVLNDKYPENANTRLISPSFIIDPNANTARLSFYHWFQFDDLFDPNDQGEVEIKRKSSNQWQTLSNPFKGSSGSWSQVFIDLNDYKGDTVQIAFHFESNNVGNKDGWYIDDVFIENIILDLENLENLGYELNLYPNPTDDQLSITLELPYADLKDFSILDLAGKEIQRLDIGEGNSGKREYYLDVAHVPAGTYLCRMRTGSGVLVKKLMIVR